MKKFLHTLSGRGNTSPKFSNPRGASKETSEDGNLVEALLPARSNPSVLLSNYI